MIYVCVSNKDPFRHPVEIRENAAEDAEHFLLVERIAAVDEQRFLPAYHVIGEKVGMAWGSGKSLM